MIDGEEVFSEALSLPPEARRAFLERATEDDPEQLDLLLRMVRVHESGFDPLADGLIAIDPKKIGPYEILGRIGEGGMGVVYLAQHPTLPRQDAIKVLAPGLAQDPERIRRFHREAQLVATVGHPHVATVYDFGEDRGNQYVAMEYIDGPTLADEIAAGPIGVDPSLQLLIEIAQGLAAAHEHEIIHRDLKPQNVLLHRTQGAKIVDFGIATSLGTPIPNSTDEQTGPMRTSTIGTPEYASPEQLRQEEVDGRTDVWSFGCVAYECLTGKRAFPGTRTHPGAHPRERTGTDAPETSNYGAEYPAEVPAVLRTLVSRCLQKNRDDRWASMAELVTELERIQDARRHPRNTRRPIVLVVSTLILLLLLLFLARVVGLIPSWGSRAQLAAVLMEDTNQLRGIDTEGEELWIRILPGTVRENENHQHLGESRKSLPFLIVDTGDGPEGAIVAVEPGGGPGQLHNLDPDDGTDLWTTTLSWIRPRNLDEVSQPVSVWQRQIVVPGSNAEEADAPALLVDVRNGSWYQESIQRLSLEGTPEAAYYHPGHLQFAGQFSFGDSLDQVLVFVGDNSSARLLPEFVPFVTERHCGAALVLDPRRMDGQAFPYGPEELGRDWSDLPPAREIGYLLIPPVHPDVDAAIESFEIDAVNGGIVVRTLDGRTYRTDARLRPRSLFLPTDCTVRDLMDRGEAVELPLIYICEGEISYIDMPLR